MKVKAFILIILMVSSSLFYYGYFNVMLLRAKNIAMRNLATADRSHSLKLLKVPARQQNNYSNDEIRIDGNLFDVGKREIVGDTLYLFLYHDIDEQSVLSAIGDFFKTDETTAPLFANSSSLKNVQIIYYPLYYFNILQFSIYTVIFKNKNFPKPAALLSFAFYDIITPPPRLS